MISEKFILAYARSDKEYHFNAIRNQYLRLILEQSHVQCREHIFPLI